MKTSTIAVLLLVLLFVAFSEVSARQKPERKPKAVTARRHVSATSARAHKPRVATRRNSSKSVNRRSKSTKKSSKGFKNSKKNGKSRSKKHGKGIKKNKKYCRKNSKGKLVCRKHKYSQLTPEETGANNIDIDAVAKQDAKLKEDNGENAVNAEQAATSTTTGQPSQQEETTVAPQSPDQSAATTGDATKPKTLAEKAQEQAEIYKTEVAIGEEIHKTVNEAEKATFAEIARKQAEEYEKQRLASQQAAAAKNPMEIEYAMAKEAVKVAKEIIKTKGKNSKQGKKAIQEVSDMLDAITKKYSKSSTVAPASTDNVDGTTTTAAAEQIATSNTEQPSQQVVSDVTTEQPSQQVVLPAGGIKIINIINQNVPQQK